MRAGTASGTFEHMFESAVASPLEAEELAWLEDAARFLDPPCTPANTRPSGWLALEMDADTADPSRLCDADLIDAVVGFEHLTAWAGARQARLLAEFARRRPGDDPQAVQCDRPAITSRYAPDEIGLALRLSRGTALVRLGQAAQLAATLPATLQAWETGLLDERKVRAICEATCRLPTRKATLVEDRVLARAPEQTLAQLRAALARAVLSVDREGAAERHRKARRDRRVTVGQQDEGMASLWALLSAPDARSAYEWLTLLARGLGSGDPRGMDARRADLLVGLLTGQLTYARNTPDQHPDEAQGTNQAADATATADTEAPDEERAASVAPPRPVTPAKPLVQVVMPYTTLIGADDQPCELVGYGPIPADLAREIAADAVWHRLVTDPLSGALLDYGRATYRPPAALADFVRARDLYCREPRCRRRAVDAELDHIVPFPLGPTSAANLNGNCLHHHHHMKHAPGWQVSAHPNGPIEWITPTGHSYLSEPHDYRPEPEPPPPRAEPTRPEAPRSRVADPSADCEPAPF
jgi:hypothetical protein